MPFSAAFFRTHRALSIRLLGLLLFLIAFALPAVRTGKPHDQFSPTFTGWECARIASSGIYEVARWSATPHGEAEMGFNDTLLLALAGLVNPLVVAQFLSFAQKRRWIGWLLSGATVGAMIATWALFARMHICPLVGHVLWIAGAVLVMAAGALKNKVTA